MGKNNFFSWVRKKFSRSDSDVEHSDIEQFSDSSELERLTADLLKETEATLQRNFERSIADYGDFSQEGTGQKEAQRLRRAREREILDEEKAREILMALLKDAITYRKMLSVRIERDVETGALFTRYYGKMQVINAQTIEAYEKLQIMDRDKDAFEYQQAVYEKLVGKIYQSDVIPRDINANPDGSSSAQAVEAKKAVRATKRIPRRWDIFELLNLRKSVRMSQEEMERAAEDYEEKQNADLARAEEAKDLEEARKVAAEAAKRASLARAEAEAARTEEAKAAAAAAQAAILAETARTEEVKAVAETARAEADAAKTRAGAEVAKAQAEADAARDMADAEATKAQAETEAAEARAGAETAKAKVEAKVAKGKAEAETEAAKARAEAEAAKTKAEEAARARAETEAARARAEAEAAKAEAETEAAKARAEDDAGEEYEEEAEFWDDE